jgi:hypothetical protein
VIGDERRFWLLPVFQFKNDGAGCATSFQFLASPTPIPGMTQPELKTLRQEIEDIEDRRFAAAIGAEEHGHRRELVQFNLAQRTVVLYAQAIRCEECPGGGLRRVAFISCSCLFAAGFVGFASGTIGRL